MSVDAKQAPLLSDLLFPALWVDDHPRAVASYKRAIASWFSSIYGSANLRIEHAVDAKEALAKVKINYFDLLIVDSDLGAGQSGSSLVKKLRNEGIYTDIIFYTRKVSIPPEAKEEVSKGGFAKIVLENALESTTQAVIKERLERFRKVSFLRGMVISKFIDVESALNGLLMSYFEISKHRQDHFRTSVLENNTISFGAKLNALLMIAFGKQRPKKSDPLKEPFSSLGYAKIKDGIEKLRTVEHDRNNLAHCAIRPNEKLEVCTMGEKVCYDRKDVVDVLTKMSACLQFIDALSQCLSPKQ